MAVTSFQLVARWLKAAITANATLNNGIGGEVYDKRPRKKTVGQRFVIFNSYLPRDVNTANGIRVMTRDTYKVTVVGHNLQPSEIDALAVELDATIHRASYVPVMDGPTLLGHIISCTRENGIDLEETVDDDVWVYRGGLYLINARPA